MTIEESISKLKINLIRRRPFYGVILMKLNELRESDTIDIASTDGNTIFYNREYMESLTESERNFYLLHQLYHCIFMHPIRMVNKDSKVANIAADYLVNYYIDMEKEEFRRNQIMIIPPKDALMVESQEDKDLLEKLSFEQLYEILYKNMKKQEQNKNIDDNSESNGEGKSGLGKNINYQNVKEDLIRPKNVQKTSSNMRRIIQESIITNKMQGNKSMGDMPGNLLRKIEDLIGTRLPWHKYLRRYLSNIASDDLSFDTPDKNHIYRELILPGPYEDENRLEDILFVIDTSGSISDDDLNNFMTQAYNICNDFNATGKVIFFDSIVQDIFDIDEFNIDNNIKRAILGLGSSGIGKSAVIKQITERKNMGLIDLRLLLYTETDLKGIPFPNEDKTRTKWLPNDILPNVERDGERGILLVEELTSAPKRVQAAAYQLIQDRRLGEYILPEGWFIVALGNREDDNGVFVQMPSPLANRFEIHDIGYDLDIWKKNFAYKTGVNPFVISYLNFKPGALHNFVPDSTSMIFASPRTWHAVSDILNTNVFDFDDDILRYKIEGNVGEIECNSFLQFCKLKDELVSVDDILSGVDVEIPTEHDKIYLLIGSIISRLEDLRQINDIDDVDEELISKFENAINFLLKLKPEFTVLGLKDLVSLNKKLVKGLFIEELDNDDIIDFITENDYIFE